MDESKIAEPDSLKSARKRREEVMSEPNKKIDPELPRPSDARSPGVRTEHAWHEEMAASPEILAATIEGFEQIRRGEGIRITRKKK
jgi:hypothetical protein